MLFYKYLKSILFSVIFSFMFISCTSPLSKEGLIVSLNSKQLSESFNNSFPQKKEFIFGTIIIKEPIINIPKDSQIITSSINLDFQTMFTQKIKGDFSISGEPLFDKQSSSIFLQNVKIENFRFSRLKLGHAFSKTFLSSLSPMMNQIFKQYPIYKIPKDSFQGRFIKNIKIENSKLLITYGI